MNFKIKMINNNMDLLKQNCGPFHSSTHSSPPPLRTGMILFMNIFVCFWNTIGVVIGDKMKYGCIRRPRQWVSCDGFLKFVLVPLLGMCNFLF